jgi:dTDP-4-amino-4,6-dideoxygalactose transaminase
MSSDSQPNYHNNNDFVELFEQRLCDFTGAPYAVAVDRCTNAILLSLEYSNDRATKIALPANTYLSVPMTLINYGYNIKLEYREWVGHYQIGDTAVYDYAVGFQPNMYKPGEIQCLSFQQKKSLPIGKGGAILLDDPVMYKTLKRMRHDGRDSSKTVREDIDNVIMGYHMYMSPDEASRGILLLNQLQDTLPIGAWQVYPDMRNIQCLKGYAA